MMPSVSHGSSAAPSSSSSRPKMTTTATLRYTNRFRLCGSTWSECGYCKGARSSLVQREPSVSSSAFTIVCDLAVPDDNDETTATTTIPSRQQTAAAPNQGGGSIKIVSALDPALYEALLYRGWRRSGAAIYKPDNRVSCCPAYTIRLPVARFEPSKSQKRMMQKAATVLQQLSSSSSSSNNKQTTTTKQTANAETTTTTATTNQNKSASSTNKNKLKKCHSSSSTPNQQRQQAERIVLESGILHYLKDCTNQIVFWNQSFAETTTTHTTTASAIFMTLDSELKHQIQNSDAVVFKIQQPRGGGGGGKTDKQAHQKRKKHVQAETTGTNGDDRMDIDGEEEQEAKKMDDAAAVSKDEDHRPRQVVVTVYTPLCASLAGRSKGKLDREHLARALVAGLQTVLAVSPPEDHQQQQQSTPDNDAQQQQQQQTTTTTTESIITKKHRVSSGEQQGPPFSSSPPSLTTKWNQKGVTIQSVEAHAQSGQVLVHLQIDWDDHDESQSMELSNPPSSSDAAAAAVNGDDPSDRRTANNNNNQHHDDDQNRIDKKPNKVSQWLQSKLESSLKISYCKAEAAAAQVAIASLETPAAAADTSLSTAMSGVPAKQSKDDNNKAKSKEDTPNNNNNSTRNQLVLTDIPAHQSALMPEVHRLYWDYQHKVHKDPNPFHEEIAKNSATPGSSSTSNQTGNNNNNTEDGGSEGKVEDDTTAATEDCWQWAEKAPKQWFKKVRSMLQNEYQHLDPERQKKLTKSFGDFYTFLVENPYHMSLSSSSSTSNNTSTTTKANTTTANHNTSSRQQHFPLGCYHQHYRLYPGGPLVAVGVMDILPQGFSSVYLFYDNQFSQTIIPMGKYAIMREIQWTQEAHLPYYYLGYYIESCPKMRYKADYKPSELLCFETFEWVDAEEAKTTIQKVSPEHHSCRLFRGKEKNKKLSKNTASLANQIPLDVGVGQAISLDMLQDQGQAIVRPHLEGFLKAAGPQIATQSTIVFC